MKKIFCFLILLGLICVVQADNKKKQPSAPHAPSGKGNSAPTMSRGPVSSHGSSQFGSHVQSHSTHASGPSGTRSSASKTNNPLKQTSSHAASASHSANPLTKSSGQTSAKSQKSNPLTQKAPNTGTQSHALTQGTHPGTSVAAHGVHPAYANYHVRPYREVFHDYHRVYRDRGWYAAHYDHLAIVGGGYYYWDAGYWYPAWGYDPAFVGYVYDGPIYSYANLPPDQVVVNVQSALQDQGYYTGDVDGQLGPQTRDAVAAYQKDHNLDVTAAVDEPTVESLGLTS